MKYLTIFHEYFISTPSQHEVALNYFSHKVYNDFLCALLMEWSFFLWNFLKLLRSFKNCVLDFQIPFKVKRLTKLLLDIIKHRQVWGA